MIENFWLGLSTGLIVGGWSIAHAMRRVTKEVMKRWEKEISEKAIQDYILTRRHND